MSFRKIFFQREDLYKKVWEKALILVAADYGISDNQLTIAFKITPSCYRERPARGYKYKKQVAEAINNLIN